MMKKIINCIAFLVYQGKIINWRFKANFGAGSGYYYCCRRIKRSLTALIVNFNISYVTVVFLLTFLYSANAGAIPAAIDIVGKNPQQAKELIENTFKKIGAGFVEEEETEGFAYRYKDTFFTPYDYNLYIGTYATGKTLVRIDTDNRLSYALGDVILQENGHKPFKNKYTEKSVLLGDTLTFIMPTMGLIYTNYNSPLAYQSIIVRSMVYVVIDAFLLWVGSKTFFTHDIDVFGRGLVATSILLGSHRLYHLIPHHMQLVVHNRLVSLGYTFRF